MNDDRNDDSDDDLDDDDDDIDDNLPILPVLLVSSSKINQPYLVQDLIYIGSDLSRFV